MSYAKEVKPYTAEGSKKEQVSNMFNNIARYYDFLNHFLSLGIDKLWRKRVIRELKKSNPRHLLDVATGTADVAITVANKIDVDKVIGLDIAIEMLEIGRKKVRKQNLNNTVELISGDAENLPFEDNTFDAITVAFGVRNFEHLDKGLAEMHRVLKPQGKLVVLEFSKPTLFPFKQLFNFYFSTILPFIGRITSKDPKAYRYLYESVQAFPDGEAFLSRLNAVGYENIKQIPLTFGISSIYLGTKQNI
ncbi:MAG: bifunctional demethylmenaquinone methyltransferase/2-methoxy-6-polyprenyl-1,4-benzoquinol methylase UbiE [Bacteroidota bacterium]